MSAAGKFTLFVAYVVCSVAGLAILRSFLPAISARATPGARIVTWLILGAGLYLASFAAWLLILRSVQLSIAYPAAVGLTICGTTAIAPLLLHERLRLDQLAGIALVLLGVFLILRRS